MMNKLCIFALVLLAVAVSAQIRTNQAPLGWQMLRSRDAHVQSRIGDLSSLRTIHVNVDQMAIDAFINEKNARKTGPYFFAMPTAVSVSPAVNGDWIDSTKADGMVERVWQAHIHADNALSLGLSFSSFKLMPNEELYVYTPDSSRKDYLGAFTAANNNDKFGTFITQPLPGQDLVVEFHTLESNLELVAARLKIDKVHYGFRCASFACNGHPASKAIEARAFGDSGTCEINEICEDLQFGNLSRAISIVIVDGSAFCSGTLINPLSVDPAQPSRQLFQGAWHCFDSFDAAQLSTVIFAFNYKSHTCAKTTLPPPLQSVEGATLLLSNVIYDIALLEITAAIPSDFEVAYAGISVDSVVPGPLTGLHHPAGDVMKVSHGPTVTPATSFFIPQCETCFDCSGAACAGCDACPHTHHQITWTSGVTEPGSSGSGLFDANKRLVGWLTGGASACGSPDKPDVYGASNQSFAEVAEYRALLDPLNTGVKTSDFLVPPDNGIIYTPNGCLCPPNFLNDTFCDWNTLRCNTAECNWDGGDCCKGTCTDPNCGINGFLCLDTAVTNECRCLLAESGTVPSGWVGDSACDDAVPDLDCNSALCQYDGGDCCEQSCSTSGAFGCVQPFVCKDPQFIGISLEQTVVPSAASIVPTAVPSALPSGATAVPSVGPTALPSGPTTVPSAVPTSGPSGQASQSAGQASQSAAQSGQSDIRTVAPPSTQSPVQQQTSRPVSQSAAASANTRSHTPLAAISQSPAINTTDFTILNVAVNQSSSAFDEQAFVQGLAAVLNVQPQQIVVNSVNSGSTGGVVVNTMLFGTRARPSAAITQQLLNLVLANDPAVQALGITSVSVTDIPITEPPSSAGFSGLAFSRNQFWAVLAAASLAFALIA